MKICYIYSLSWSVPDAHMTNLLSNCEALSRAGHTVYLLTPFVRNNVIEDAFHLYGITKNFKVRRMACPEPYGYGNLGMLARATYCAQALCAVFVIRPDVVYTSDFTMLYFLSMVPRFLLPKAPVIFEAHKVYSRAAKLRKVGEKQEIAAMKAADRVVCISNGVKNDLIALGCPEEKLHVLPNAVALSKFNAGRRSDHAAHNIVYTGSFLYWKGVDILVDAFVLLLKEMPDTKLYLVGDDHEGNRRKLEAQIRELGLEKSVVMTGYVSQREVAGYLGMADAAVLPNRVTVEGANYTSPSKIFEYMAARVPIVVSDLPSIREIVDGEAAVLVAPDDAKALCDGLLHLLKNPDVGSGLADMAYQVVKSNYTLEMRAQHITQILGEK